MSATLLHSPAEVIRWLLVAIGQGVDPAQGGDWQVAVALEESSPDNAITVYDTDSVKYRNLEHYP